MDDRGNIIMDYSIHDAIKAGFNKVIFVIRKDIEEDFRKVIGDRIESICSEFHVSVEYAFQDIDDIPGVKPEGRTKLWGTGHAVLAARDIVKDPFVVINADDDNCIWIFILGDPDDKPSVPHAHSQESGYR